MIATVHVVIAQAMDIEGNPRTMSNTFGERIWNGMSEEARNWARETLCDHLARTAARIGVVLAGAPKILHEKDEEVDIDED